MVARTFRPEFINRLDKVIVFKPLSRELMREILHKELRHVMERRGLKNREWAVEWEPSAIEFLLDRGFSPAMGARPLKRAIDQYLLAPLAATLVEHRFPKGDQFLFVRSNGKAIEVEFVDPDAEEAEDSDEPTQDTSGGLGSLASVILHPGGTTAERKLLEASWKGVRETLQSDEWNGLKDRLHREISTPDIWSRPDRTKIFSRVALIDRVIEASKTAERLQARLVAHASKEMMGRVALQLHLIEQGIADVRQDAPIDAILIVDTAFEEPGDGAASAAWCSRLREMYRRWAERRHMQFDEIGPLGAGPPIFQIGGFGAFRTLAQEVGLHVWEEPTSGQRTVARVKVAPGPATEPGASVAYKTLANLLAASADAGSVVRRYREQPDPLVRDAKNGWRSGRPEIVFRGDFDLLGAAPR